MRLKQTPEDFMVKEINDINISLQGKYCAFTLHKKNWNTIDAVREIANRIGINEKDIRYSGLKDRNAVTEQLITININNQKIVSRLKINDIKLTFLGWTERHATTSDNKGNKFIITIRGLDKQITKKPKKIPNYYDEQRFGNDGKNHLVGKLIIKKQFKEACELLGITAENGDYVSALKKTGLTHIYFSAYQSYLFNNVLSSFVMQSCKKIFYLDISGMMLAFPALFKGTEEIPEELPIVAFDTEFFDAQAEKAYETLLKKDGITLRDFAIKQFPNLVTSSPKRQSFMVAEGFRTTDYSEDEFNKGKMKQAMEFSLPKGSYATLVIKALTGKSLLTG